MLTLRLWTFNFHLNFPEVIIIEIEIKLNGEKQQFDVEPGETLLELLRREGYWSVKKGDDVGETGADTVLLDEKPVASVVLLAAQVDGREVETVEGLGSIYDLHPIQEAYLETGAIQCGFCTPGMVLTTKALLDENPEPTREDARMALDGNLCRCTGYKKPVDAILSAAEKLQGTGELGN